MLVVYGSSKIASYSKEMSKSLYVALVSPGHKITFSEELNSSLTIKSSLSLYGYTGCLNQNLNQDLNQKSKSNGIANLLSKAFLTTFSWLVTVSAVPSVLSHQVPPLDHWPLDHWPTFFIAQIKILACVKNIWVVNRINFFWTKQQHHCLIQKILIRVPCQHYSQHYATCLLIQYKD